MTGAARLSLDKLTRRFSEKLAVDALSLEIASGGVLRAAGNFSGPVGPSWSGVRDRKAGNPK